MPNLRVEIPGLYADSMARRAAVVPECAVPSWAAGCELDSPPMPASPQCRRPPIRHWGDSYFGPSAVDPLYAEPVVCHRVRMCWVMAMAPDQ